MTGLLGISSHLLVLLPLSMAAGADLFLTLLLLTALDTGWIPEQSGLPQPLWWGSLGLMAFFYLLETWMELRPFRALVWHNSQLIVRPLAASLLAAVVLDDPWALSSLPLILCAGIIGAFSHVMGWGGKLHRFLSPDSRISSLTHAIAEDTLVLVLLVLTMEVPDLAFLLSLGLLLAGVAFGGSRRHLTHFGLSLLKDTTWGVVSPARWRETPELPTWIQNWSKAEGSMGVSGLRAGAEGLPSLPGFRSGWLLQAGSRYVLAFNLLRGPRFLSLEAAEFHPAEPLSLARRIPVGAPDGSQWALFLHGTQLGPKSHK